MTVAVAAQGRKSARRPWVWKVWSLYAAGFVPACWAFYLGATGELGADPVKSFEHVLGLWALRFLILTLLVTPVRDLTGISLLRYRRALGLLAFYYALMHFTAYMVLDQALNIPAIIADITRRPFITIGMASFALLIPLALTSNNWSIRKLGRRWNRLHKLIYIAVAGGAVHFMMSVKGWPAEPVIYVAIVATLLAWRLLRPLMRNRTAADNKPRR
ncbi:protein-methionine-sulfoxide reductase heme-binding subunit MsrQ [Falsochrobactrum sp. TDYN1]|uniref:Protein-methionine-sulfoxide reductase heme-binding subunit MsrQ n=1 Tax=Falsochrobactrum tianjinense TaxID=2706015 RepID=A0A949UUT6_9HYPH|nr:protein-methionine-sulfoxide reductase heme-binding subunit MsrQ [Falsochrobactrum sp. TDYN1]MBV2144147.1 protein-methionine-sulfoxide reductase heme-binding subunit MsrQ [Falsochrobactrum sp. TDYN1]